MASRRWLVPLCAAFFLGLAASWALPNAMSLRGAESAPPATADARTVALRSLAPLLDELRPTAVAIRVSRQSARIGSGQRHDGEAWFLSASSSSTRRGRPRDVTSSGEGTGSGVVISPSGEILTAQHLVQGLPRITVRFPDGREMPATIIGGDPWTDLALLKVDPGPTPFRAATFGDSDGLRVGDWVVGLGYPFGLGLAAATGIVSATGQVIGHGPYDEFIQTDTAGNPGNSGGPLFDVEGRLVGIHSAGWDGGQGLSFAVPSTTAAAVVAQLRARGRVVRGWMGISTPFPVPGHDASDAGPGVRVARVAPNSPAATAGVRAGDRVVAVAGEPVTTAYQFARITSRRPVGSSVSLIVRRGEARRTVEVRIAELPPAISRPH